MSTTRLPPSAHAAAYYHQVGPTMLAHLVARELVGSRPGRYLTVDEPARDHEYGFHIETTADLDAAVLRGIVGFEAALHAEPGLIAVAVRAGADAQIDTVATATLMLAESMATDGLVAVPMTDGAGGLQLIACRAGDAAIDGQPAAAARYAGELTQRAPEVATMDEADAEGRALVLPLSGRSEAVMAVPYSLVLDGSHGDRDDPAGHLPFGVVVPLSLDDVAAATAGMRLQIGLWDVAGRISMFGDLAAALRRRTNPSA